MQASSREAAIKHRISAHEQPNVDTYATKAVVMPVPPNNGDTAEVPCFENGDANVAHYKLTQSVLDALLVLNFPEVGPRASAMLFSAILLTFFVQGFFCFVLFTSNDFVNLNRFTEMVQDARRWRLTEGHKLSYMNMDGVNIVSQVCNGNNALSLAQDQVTIISQINSYLGLSPDQFALNGFGLGPLLTVTCICCHGMSVAAELREVICFLLALLALPKGPRTQFNGSNAVVAISIRDFLCNLFLLLVRVVIAAMLLYAGSAWLLSTSAIAELILNAAALSFVMEVDELVFKAVVSDTVKKAVDKTAPLSFRQPLCDVEALLPLVSICAVIIWFWFVPLDANIQSMLNVKNEICGGFQEFVVSGSPLGIIHARRTHRFERGVNMNELQVRAVRELTNALDLANDSNGGVLSSWWHNTRIEEFEKQREESMTQATADAHCIDHDAVPWTLEFRKEWPFYFSTVNWIVDPKGAMGLPNIFYCKDYARFCDDRKNPLLRYVCPRTCGCHSLTSGLLYAGSDRSDGCPLTCLDNAWADITSIPCVDLSVTSKSPESIAVSTAWKRHWNSYANFQSVYFPNLVEMYAAWTATQISLGCNASMMDPLANVSLCDPDGPSASVLRPIFGFCPKSCCSSFSSTAKRAFCPAACG
eukprot:TRINITY_DN5052_c0_g1_i3.p1 TRINITY_DN5052_c0_g1~~TRINITY_DN5052_c0_g1_i3.p1  ORF type:complete len:731 (+),score=69.93 TRINITY_DN5052_c0_g1_i3:256-2193(+)